MIGNRNTYRLKRLLLKVTVLVCTIALTRNAFGQEPPPYFRLVFENDTIHSDTLLKTYQFQSFMYASSRVKKTHALPESVEDRLVLRLGEGFVEVNMFGEDHLRFPRTGDMAHLRIIDKSSGAQMNIIIRLSYNMTYSENLTMSNVRFVEGTYFMDMCNPESKYGIPKGGNFRSDINTRAIDNHRVLPKKLKKIIKKHKCSESNDE